jgi:6-phosphogluconolactonase (cycloisomerase 2 family)
VFHPTKKVAYIVNELISSVSVLEIGDLSRLEGERVLEENSTGEGELLVKDVGLISTLPGGAEKEGTWHAGGVWKADSHCSEIRIDALGKFLYIGTVLLSLAANTP